MNRTDALIGQLQQLPRAGDLSSGQLLDRIAARDRIATTLAADQIRDLARFEAQRVAEDRQQMGRTSPLVGRSVPLEVATVLRVAPMTAQGRLATAAAMVDDHPALLDLMSFGRLSPGAVHKVLAETSVLSAADRRAVDVQLASDQQAGNLTPGQLGMAAKRRVLARDPDAAARRVEQARADRWVRRSPVTDGTARLIAQLSAETTLVCDQTLDHHARAARAAGDPRAIERIRADLLVEALTGTRPTQTADTSGAVDPAEPPPTRPWDEFDPADPTTPDPYHDHQPVLTEPGAPFDYPPGLPAGPTVEIQVVVDLPTFLGLTDSPGLLRGAGPLPAQTIRQIADHAADRGDATIRRLLCDRDAGALLTMDSTARRYVGSLRDYVVWRDQTDRLTGTQAIREIDHITPWTIRPETTADGGQSLSKATHRIKDHPHIDVQALRGNAPTLRWTMPTGHSIDLPPPPVMGWGTTPADTTRLIHLDDDPPPPETDEQWWDDTG